MGSWGVEEFDAGDQKLNLKLQNKYFVTVLSVRLRSVERPRLEDKKGVLNVHTNTPSRLRLDTIASEVEEVEGEMEEDYEDM